MKATYGERFFYIFNYIFLAVLSFAFLFPFWRIIALSLNEGADAAKGGIYFWPREFTLENFTVIFARGDILDAYKITVFRTVLGTFISVFLMALMAYGLSKKALRGRKVINIMLLITMFFNGGMIPTYLLYRKLGILNNFLVYVLPFLYIAYNIFIFRAFYRSMSIELEESAKIDGANDLTVFFRIVFPLSMPILATISLFMAVTQWNDYLTGMLYVTDRKLLPLQTLLVKIITESQVSEKLLQGGVSNLSEVARRRVTTQAIRMSTLVSAVIPIMCVYPFLQKHFVKGIMIGSLKG